MTKKKDCLEGLPYGGPSRERILGLKKALESYSVEELVLVILRGNEYQKCEAMYCLEERRDGLSIGDAPHLLRLVRSGVTCFSCSSRAESLLTYAKRGATVTEAVA